MTLDKKHMIYYHCIRSDYYTPKFYCHRYENNNVIPRAKDCFESLVIPIPRNEDPDMHTTILLRHLQDKISIHLVKED
jgi:hypothetical protein